MIFRQKAQKGSILIFVLGLIILISVISVRLMEETTQELRHVTQTFRKDELRVYAYSCLDLAVSGLHEWNSVANALENHHECFDVKRWSEMWGSSLETLLGDENEDQQIPISWNINFTDETKKIPITNLEKKEWSKLFAYFMSKDNWSNISEDDGEALWDSFMDWEDKDTDVRNDGAEDEYYEDLIFSYFPPNRKVRSFREFRFIRGFGMSHVNQEKSGVFFDDQGYETQDFVDFKNTFSFYNDGEVNLSNPTDLLIKYLADFDEFLFEQLIDLKNSDMESEREEFRAKIEELARKKGIKPTRRINFPRFEIKIAKGKAEFQLHCVLQNGKSSSSKSKPGNKNNNKSKDQTNDYPFSILALKENENLID